jgi:D-alanine-D-alanine ligase
MASRNETRVAVFLGGRSPEHDVSVITGLQALKAIDQERFIAFPVYVDPRGRWLVGDPLAERRNYLPDARIESELT